MPSGRLVQRVRGRAGRVRRRAYRRRDALVQAWREQADADHLVPHPVFVLSPVRSGSTLLRVLLDTHSEICAPHELHLNTLRVSTNREYARKSLKASGLSLEDLENLLWDRALHRLLVRTGKRIIVDKTPQNAMVWPRIHEFWPGARYLHLHRHPASMVASLDRARPDQSTEFHVERIRTYGEHLDAARAALPGPTIRYEELTVDPERVTQEICRYLGVPWQRRMLKYKKDTFRAGIGDWSANIKSGRIQPARPLPEPDEVPEGLRELSQSWGYL